jgi:cytidylate kinase
MMVVMAGSRIITISASFGAGGAIVGPAVADRAGLPFLDRAIPVAVAETLAVPLGEALEHDERRPSALERIMASMAGAGTPLGAAPAIDASIAVGEDDFRAATERVIRDLADRSGGVILGRAGAIVLRGHAGALHVRLDGPREARIARVMDRQHLDRDAATRRVDETDRAWESYVKFFYKINPRDPKLYHLMIDSTALTLETVTDLIVAAADGRKATVDVQPDVSP